jgi:hypothetical protein
MRAEWTAAEIEEHVRGWPVAEQDEVRALLASYGAESHHREPLRVRRVLLQSCDASLERLRRLTAMAKRDYRDLLQRDPGPNA